MIRHDRFSFMESLSVCSDLFPLVLQLAEGCGVKETPQQKYQRLVNEIHELCQDVERIQVKHRLLFHLLEFSYTLTICNIPVSVLISW